MNLLKPITQSTLLLIACFLINACKPNSHTNENQWLILDRNEDTSVFHIEKTVEESDDMQSSSSIYKLSMDWKVIKIKNQYFVTFIDLQYILQKAIYTSVYDTSEDSVIVVSEYANLAFNTTKQNEVNKGLEELKKMKDFSFTITEVATDSFDIDLPQFPVSEKIKLYDFSPYSNLKEDLNPTYLKKVFRLMFEHPTGSFEKRASWKTKVYNDSILYYLTQNITHDAYVISGHSEGLDLQLTIGPDNGAFINGSMTEINKKSIPNQVNKSFRISVTKAIQTEIINASLDSAALLSYRPASDSTVLTE